MAFPFHISYGNTSILFHSIAEILAFFAGFKYFQYLKKEKGDHLSSTSRGWVLAGAIFGALLGSRLLGGLEDPSGFKEAKNLLNHFYQNKTVVGGFLGGLVGVELVKKIIGEKKSSGDLFVKPILLALIIGRLGCFSMGIYEETYGLRTSLPWGMNLGDGIFRHPVTIYEILFLTGLWIGISVMERKYMFRPGSYFKIFMIAYLLFRFLLDFIKPHYNLVMGLSTIQLTCIAGLLYYYPDIRYMNQMMIKPEITHG